MHVPSFPRRVQVELTNYCNQRCRYCPRQAFTRPLGFLQQRLFERVAEECAQYGARMWLHFLGEPLLHRQVVDFCRYAKQAGVPEVGLSTNAVSLRGSVVEGLLKSGLDRLECSLDADDAATYLALRGRDHFQRVCDNIAALLGRKRALGLLRPIVSLQVLLAPENRAALPAIVARWRPLLEEPDFIMTIEPVTFGGTAGLSAPARGPRQPCHWLFEALVVLQDGTVTTCGTDWDAKAPVGNANQQSLYEIWHSAEMRQRRAAHLARRFGELPLCASCNDWPLADGHGYRNVLQPRNRAGAHLPKEDSVQSSVTL